MKLFHLILLSFCFLLPLGALHASNDFLPQFDTVRYKGYRLELYQFEVIKKTDTWLKVQFSAINTGRMDIDLNQKGREHWVQFNFDQTVFDKKLGGYRDHIRYQLAKDGFKLSVGEQREKVELKFPVILPASAQRKINEPKNKQPAQNNQVVFEPPKNEEQSRPVHSGMKTQPKTEKVNLPVVTEKEAPAKKCPDLRFEDLRIVKQDGKWATLEYTIVNEGEGVYHLFETEKGRDDGLIVRAYISGVSVLSRGALPIGGQVPEPSPGVKNELRKGEEYQARLKLDVRKKTRYMKSLILKLDGPQFAVECDRKNNTAAVVLE